MKNHVPKRLRKIYNFTKRKTINIKQLFICIANKKLRKKEFLANGKLHLGCGEIRLNDFVNIDYRPTKATDMAMNCVDLNYFPDNSISMIYSNSFFEHLYMNERLPALKSYLKVLKKDGFLIMLGIPDFENIAKTYLSKKPGIFAKTFDASEVYRLTHGDPEKTPTWWLQQLHKSIFDKSTIESLLQQAGYRTYTVFSNHYQDLNVNLSLGFVAAKKEVKLAIDEKWLKENIPLLNQTVNKNSIKVVASKIAD